MFQKALPVRGFGRFFSASVFDKSCECFLESLEANIMLMSLNRASRKNALGKVLVDDLFSCLDHIYTMAQPPSTLIVRSLVPKAFCTGADLKERSEMTPNEIETFVKRLRLLTSTIADLPMPTIASLQGFALGGGLELALACDLRVAETPNSEMTPELIFGLPETSLAIIPGAGGTQRLPRLIGMSKAKELIFTARRFGSEEALQLGIVDRLTSDAFEGSVDLARQISKNVSYFGICSVDRDLLV